MAMLAWPSISETTFGFTFLESKSVAHVCRRSWKRISGKPARLSKGLKRRAVMCCRESGEPLSEAKMRPFSRHRSPARSIFPQLTLQVASERFQGSLRESHGAASTLGLRRGKDRSTLRGGKGAPHLQSPDLKVNVIPFEPQQLSLPQPGGNGQDVEGFEAVALRGLDCLQATPKQPQNNPFGGCA